MRYFFIFILISMYNECNCQTSISFGTAQIKENFLRNKSVHFFTRDKVFLYKYYTIQGDYTKSFFTISSEVLYLPASFTMHQIYRYSTGGGSSPTYNDRRDYYSDVNIEYLAIKLALGSTKKFELKKNWWCTLSYNIYGQYDRLIKKTESNQVMKRTTSSNNNQTHTTITTVHPANYSYFELIDYKEKLAQFGLDIKGRIGNNRYFSEFSISLGSAYDFRSYPTIYDMYGNNRNLPESKLNMRIGVKVGCYLYKTRSKT